MGKKITFAMLEREKRKRFKKWMKSDQGKKAMEAFKNKMRKASEKASKDKETTK